MEPETVLERFLEKHRLEGTTLLVGFSGGVDSTVLLHLLSRLRNRFSLSLHALHLNHGLRGKESDRDALFCRKICRELDVFFRGESADIRKIAQRKSQSIELAARNHRRRVLLDYARDRGIRHLFLAHTEDDQVETMMLRLGRGTGLFGITGMKEIAFLENVYWCRPLLAVSKKKLVKYAREGGIPWREDATNLDAACTRNRLRNRAIPELEAAFGRAFRPAILRFGGICRESLDEFRSLLDRTFPGSFCCFPGRVLIDLEQIRGIGPAGFTEMLRAALQRSGLAFFVPDRDASRRLFDLIARETGKRAAFLPGVIAEKDRGFLHLYRQGERCPDMFRPESGFREGRGVLSLPFKEADPAFYRSLARGDRSVWRYAFKAALDRKEFSFHYPEDAPLLFRKRLAGYPLKERYSDKRVPRWLVNALPVVFYGEKPILVPGICGDPDYVRTRGIVLEFEFHPCRSAGEETGGQKS